MAVELPYLEHPYFLEGSELRMVGLTSEITSPEEALVLRRTFPGGASVPELAAELASEAELGPEAAERRVREILAKYSRAIGVTEVDVEPEYDVVVVEQGYGGVYVHTTELLKRLSERWRCLLICPETPLFSDSTGTDTLTLRGLREKAEGLSYFSFVHLVRSVVRRTKCRLLLITHRSQSLFLFDLLRKRKTVIYCDGFFDGGFAMGRDFRLVDDPDLEHRVLRELYYVYANSNPDFFGVNASPSQNVEILTAGCYSLRDAVENWCWGREQTDNFRRAFPDLGERVRFEPPFTDPDLFHPEWVERERRILFTTTMHNIDKKGFPELTKALKQLRSARVRCVVRQPDRLPPIPDSCRERMEIGPVKKSEMVRIYHRTWVNCRTSREESSPVSILEAMICELPQIVSPVVASQIPIMEDGKTGFIVDPDDTKGLVRALRTILDDADLRDEMGRECRARASTYAFDERSSKFEELLA